MSGKSNAPSSKSMESKFRKLGTRLDRLVVKTRRAKAGARVKLASELETLKARRRLATKILARLGRRGAAAGGPLKTGVRKAWSDLKAAAHEAGKRYRETA